MNLTKADETLNSIVRNFIPKNLRKYKRDIYDGQPQTHFFGMQIDPRPFEGKVIHIDEEAIYIKTGRIDFAIVNKELVNQTPSIEDKVLITPYARRDFSRARVDAPRNEGNFEISRLGGWELNLPVDKPKNLYLVELINQIEQIKAPDGIRHISHMLIDANATNFSVVDPSDRMVIATPPSISFEVSTTRFQGIVTITYMRVTDTYTVEFKTDGSVTQKQDDVYFDDLGQVLFDRFDDGLWRQIKVEVLKTSKKRT